MQKFLLLVCLVALQAGVFAQAPSQQAVKASLDSNGVKYQAEKVYIQYDKPAYSAGETVWFKAYILKGFENSNLSKTFYVDFSDTDGNVLMHGVYPVQISSAAGNFDIPAWYKGKNVHVRAYTKWMLNFDSSFLYNKDIRIIKKEVATAGNKPNIKPAQTAAIQFFPEGGDCVAGIRSKVAFKAMYNNGLPAAVTGTIVNSRGEVLDTITTQHDGMGFFYLEAQPGETYTARWRDGQETVYQSPLPAIKTTGTTLEIKTGKDKTGFILRRTDDAADNFKELHIVATMQQQVVYMATVKLDSTNVMGGSIPTSQLPSGILQITLLDAKWLPVAERITFINNDDYHFAPEISFTALNTGKRGRNVLVISVPDSIESNLSVSITDAGLEVDSSDDIISHLLVTGDLKGRVYHPSYYFSNNSDSVAQHLDLVMLTNGWRRFKFNNILAGNTPPLTYQPDTSYLTLMGKVNGIKPDKIKGLSTIMLMLKSTNPADTAKDFLMLPLNNDGSFTQPGYSFNDTLIARYKFSVKKDKGLNGATSVTFNSGVLDAPKHISFHNSNYFEAANDTALNTYYTMFAYRQAEAADLIKQSTLKNVTVTAKVKSRLDTLDDRYTSGLFNSGNIASRFDLVNDRTSMSTINAFTYLQSKVPGMMISNPTLPTVSIKWRGKETQVFVDEMPVPAQLIIDMSAKDIAYIKVLRPPFIGAPGGGGGAIAIYTRRGDEVSPWETGQPKTEQRLIGYTSTKEFYSPDYSTDSVMHAVNDNRATLYWAPWVITTGQNPKISIPFYNNDITSKMRVIIEGIDGNGRLTRVEKLVQ